jgi:hypothetical protein
MSLLIVLILLKEDLLRVILVNFLTDDILPERGYQEQTDVKNISCSRGDKSVHRGFTLASSTEVGRPRNVSIYLVKSSARSHIHENYVSKLE